MGPSIGALITAVGYPFAFALVALSPLASLLLIPRRDEQQYEQNRPPQPKQQRV